MKKVSQNQTGLSTSWSLVNRDVNSLKSMHHVAGLGFIVIFPLFCDRFS